MFLNTNGLFNGNLLPGNRKIKVLMRRQTFCEQNGAISHLSADIGKRQSGIL